jgi:pyruvate formate lyase activating enzyme
VAALERARSVAMSKGIHYAYVGNVPGHEGNHTYCPGCGKMVIQRSGFLIGEVHITHGCCEFCGTKIAGVWS